LIVDEVLAVGDAAFQKQCLDKMDDVSKSGRTLIFVSHNLSTIQQFCDRTICLDHGALEYDGATPEAIQHYLNKTQSENYGLGTYSLEDHRRYGNGDVVFDKIELSANNKAPDDINVIRKGDDLVVDLWMKADQRVNDANVALIVFDMFGTRTIDANLAILGEAASFEAGEMKQIRFTLKDLLLKPGEYILGLWCGIPNTDVDGIDEAVRFRIDEPLGERKYSITFTGVYQCEFDVEY